MATYFPFNNPLYFGSGLEDELTEEQKRYMLGRSMLAAGLGMRSQFGQPMSKNPNPLAVGMSAFMNEYDSLAQTALQAQMIKQRKEEKRQEREDVQTMRSQNLALETARLAEQVKVNESMMKLREQQGEWYEKRAAGGGESAATKKAKDLDVEWSTKWLPYLAGRVKPNELMVIESEFKAGNRKPLNNFMVSGNILGPQTIKIGDMEYQIGANGLAPTTEETKPKAEIKPAANVQEGIEQFQKAEQGREAMRAARYQENRDMAYLMNITGPILGGTLQAQPTDRLNEIEGRLREIFDRIPQDNPAAAIKRQNDVARLLNKVLQEKQRRGLE